MIILIKHILLFLAITITIGLLNVRASGNDMKMTEYIVSQESQSTQKNEKNIIVHIVTESVKPLQDAFASLYEKNGCDFIKADFRDRPVPANGTLNLPLSVLAYPKGSELFVYTKDGFYWHETKIHDFKVRSGVVEIVVPKTGIITLTIANFTKGEEHALVVPVFKLNSNGSYDEFTGIGIGSSFSYPFSINGLPSGIYKIQIKKTYSDTRVYFEKIGIKVVAGENTDIGKIELQNISN